MKNQRVLVIEDDPDTRAVLVELLEMWGYAVEVAVDGAEGLRMALEGHPAIVIVDVGLPLASGFDVAQRLRELPEGERPIVVALTGWTRDEDRSRGFQSGMDAYLSKPIDPETLKEMLSFATEVRQRR